MIILFPYKKKRLSPFPVPLPLPITIILHWIIRFLPIARSIIHHHLCLDSAGFFSCSSAKWASISKILFCQVQVPKVKLIRSLLIEMLPHALYSIEGCVVSQNVMKKTSSSNLNDEFNQLRDVVAMKSCGSSSFTVPTLSSSALTEILFQLCVHTTLSCCGSRQADILSLIFQMRIQKRAT